MSLALTYHQKYYRKNKSEVQKLAHEWYQKNREQMLQKKKEYRIIHQKERSEYNKKWRLRNPEIYRAGQKRYRDKHKDKMSQLVMSWAKKNPERVKQIQHKTYLKHREEQFHKHKLYVKNNRIRINFLNNKRRIQKLHISGIHSLEQWKKLLVLVDYYCVGCWEKFKQLTEDHIIPISKKGTDDITNIQPLCRSCNSRKNNNLNFRFGDKI